MTPCLKEIRTQGLSRQSLRAAGAAAQRLPLRAPENTAQSSLITVSTALITKGMTTAMTAMIRMHSRILVVFLLLRFMDRVYAKNHKI